MAVGIIIHITVGTEKRTEFFSQERIRVGSDELSDLQIHRPDAKGGSMWFDLDNTDGVYRIIDFDIKTEVCHNIFRSASSMMAFENFLKNLPKQTQHSSVDTMGSAASAAAGNASDMVSEASEAVSKAQPIRTGPKVGRNDPCPCGSGKKFKQCCGK